jgi:hypothetical protein
MTRSTKSLDRTNAGVAGVVCEALWPDANVRRAVLGQLAASIHAAHRVSPSAWEVTLSSSYIRLNVGQVETLTSWREEVRFLFRQPIASVSGGHLHIDGGGKPVYAAVPVPSGIARIAATEVSSLPQDIRTAHEAYLQEAASLKRVSPFKRAFSPGVLDYVESLLSIALPRPSYFSAAASVSIPARLPEELDGTIFNEGAKCRVTINAYERDHRARQACLAAHGTACAVCGISLRDVYGSAADGLIHVHHIRPLSEIGQEYRVDPRADLRPVCPNCHAVLHRRVPAYSIDEVRGFLRATSVAGAQSP